MTPPKINRVDDTQTYEQPCQWAKALVWSVIGLSSVAAFVCIMIFGQMTRADDRLTAAQEQIFINTNALRELQTNMVWIRDSLSKIETKLEVIQKEQTRRNSTNY